MAWFNVFKWVCPEIIEEKRMAKGHMMNVNISKVPKNPDMFEFTITTPTLRSQFRIPRVMVNKMRILIEKALIAK